MDMKTKIQLFAAFLLLAVGALWLTSCSSEDAVQGSGSQADASLTLTINTGKVGSRATAWDGTTTPTSTDENTINRLTVGIFDASTKKVKTIVELTSATTGGNSLSVSGNTATAKIVTTSLATGDDVLVAANAPAGNFAGVADETGFNAKTEGIESAVISSSDNTKEINTNIPMYGASTLNGSGSAFTAAVSVQHQLAKITLDDLEVAFDANGPYKEAEFTPTEFFLVNVPEKLAFNSDAWVNGVGHLHGMSSTTYSSLPAATEWGTYKEYLSSAATGSTALKGTSDTYASKSYFYVTPCDDASTNGKMKLIIAGTFKTNSSDAGTTVFYPVAINATYAADGTPSAATNGGTDVFKVYPNKNYKCKVVIKTIGTIDPTMNLDPQTATVTVTVDNFVDVSQTTTFE